MVIIDNWEAVEQHLIEYGPTPPRVLDKTTSIAQRAKIFGGWLVRCGESITFVPDTKHQWK